MALSYVVEEIVPIDYSPDAVEPLGTFESLDDAIACARAYVPTPRRTINALGKTYLDIFGDKYARITVQGWTA